MVHQDCPACLHEYTCLFKRLQCHSETRKHNSPISVFYNLRSMLWPSYFEMWTQTNRFIECQSLWGPQRFCPIPSSFGEGLREREGPSYDPTELVAAPKSLGPQPRCPDAKMILSPMPHSGNSLFAWMPPGCVMKTNDSLAVWFLSPLDKLAACQCTWQAPMESKAGKKWSSPPWQKPLTEHSSPVLSSLDTLAGKLQRVKSHLSVRIKEQFNFNPSNLQE